MVTPKMDQKTVKHPYDYNFVKMSKPNLGARDQSFAERLAAYMNKYNISIRNFVKLSAEYAGKYGTKITERDLSNYLYQGKSPKIDKLYAITQVMGVTIDYFCGYGPRNRRSKNPIIEARYRKRKRDN